MPRTINTPAGVPSSTTKRPLLTSDPSTWTASNVPVQVVQACPGEALRPFRSGCPSPRLDEPCPGTSEHALSCVSLDADEALHAIEHHYTYANWSICRFTDHSHVTYVPDIVWEIDAHAGPRVWISDPTYYVPSIAAAVHVGRRIYDYLVETVGVDPTYITTSITRMGARVTVDWRAVGPRTIAEVLAVVRYVETQVFGAGELEALSERLRKAMQVQTHRVLKEFRKLVDDDYDDPKIEASVTIDGGIYGVSDRATLDRERADQFKGPLCRPPGALHTLSGPAAMWCRITPVPHQRFQVRHARWLARVSRSDRGPDISTFPEPGLFHVAWPETRRPESHRAIEGTASRPRLPPADGLCVLFQNWQSLELPEVYRQEVLRQERRRRPIQLSGDAVADVTPEVVDQIVVALRPTKVRRRENRIRLTCPYCHEFGAAVVYRDSGVFTCARTKCGIGSRHLTQVALDFGLGSLVPWRRASSQPLQHRRLRDLISKAPTWETIGRLQRQMNETVDHARRWLAETLDDALGRDDWMVLIVQGPTGVGKTTTMLDALRRHGVVVRAAFPRDDNRLALVDAYEPDLPVRVIDGRRESNCVEFGRLAIIQSRGLPARLVCNASCPSRRGCPYLAQFLGIDGVSLALNHAHLHFLDLKLLDNGSDLVVIDENPLNAAVETIDLDQRELDRFRLGVEIVFEDETIDDVTLDDATVTRSAATPGVEALIRRLEEALTTDQMARSSATAGRDILADLALAQHWFCDGRLASILDGIDEGDLERHDAEVFAAAERYLEDPTCMPAPPRAVLRDLVGGLRDLQQVYDTSAHRPSSLCAVRDGSAWRLRLTQRRNLMHGRTIILSSTLTPAQFLLAFGDVVGVEVVQPEVAQRERRIIVGDRQLGTVKLLGSKPKESELRGHVFETAHHLIEAEKKRTSMPVAVMGRAAVLNAYLEQAIGEPLPARLRMPFRYERVERMAELRALTEPLGLLCGYAGGVSGSNEFAVEGRFVRSLVVLGGILPPLDDIEAHWRGAYSEYPFTEEAEEFPGMRLRVDRGVDWSVVPRTVPYHGTELGDGEATVVLAATNVFGFADALANEILRHSYEDELVQMVGRMRGCIPDPERTEARAYIIAHVAVPGWPVDEVITLDELRKRVGLEPLGHRRAGRPRHRGPEALAKRIESRGRQKTIVWMVEYLMRSDTRADLRMPKWRDCVTMVNDKLGEAGQRLLSEEEWQLAKEAAQAVRTMDRKIS